VVQKANLSFENTFPYISVIDEASDFKFGMQLRFPKAHHKITPVVKSGHGLALWELPKILTFQLNICTMAEARYLIFVTQLRFAKAHYKITCTHRKSGPAWTWARGAPIYLRFPFIISAAAALSS